LYQIASRKLAVHTHWEKTSPEANSYFRPTFTNTTQA